MHCCKHHKQQLVIWPTPINYIPTQPVARYIVCSGSLCRCTGNIFGYRRFMSGQSTMHKTVFESRPNHLFIPQDVMSNVLNIYILSNK